MKISIFTLIICISVGSLIFNYGRSIWYPYYLKMAGHRTVSDAVLKYGVKAEASLKKQFETKGFNYPPSSISLIAIKDKAVLELWAHHHNETKLIKIYPIKAASGHLGPKLKEGDRQVPEGIYEITSFNPNSSYHLSMKLNYPNKFDSKYARIEGRDYPGTNIFIHGRAVSIGCLAMGDPAIEELFTLVHKVKRSHVDVVITPSDPAEGKLIKPDGYADWVNELYQIITDKVNNIRKT